MRDAGPTVEVAVGRDVTATHVSPGGGVAVVNGAVPMNTRPAAGAGASARCCNGTHTAGGGGAPSWERRSDNQIVPSIQSTVTASWKVPAASIAAGLRTASNSPCANTSSPPASLELNS